MRTRSAPRPGPSRSRASVGACSSFGTRHSPDGRETYHLTKKGLDFVPVIIALTKWGDRWAAADGAPIVYEHGCGGRMTHVLQCTKCGEAVQPGAVTARK